MVLRGFEGYNIDPSCYFATDRYRNTGSPTPATTSNVPFPIKAGFFLGGWMKLRYFTEPPILGAFNKLKFASEPPVPSAWNKLLYDGE